MTTIIKSQIVKQLARFTKNLSPSKISLKFLKGEGELRNLELNETFLTELLELPPFIRLTRAVCNKISAKFHWTRLKTDPIRLFLDCVDVEMEMTENVTEHEVNQTSPRQSTASHQTSKEKPSEYGFVEKVVDGMLVTINSVVMAFKTPTFRATFQMSHLSVHSTDPNWQIASLRNTRIKDGIGKEVLTFKQITFGTLRVDADALYSSSEEEASPSSSPLRVITSSAKLNIVIKKKIQDCSVVSARLHVLLDDVLWVLTHAQLQAVAGFAKSVVQVVEKSKKCEPAPSMASDDSMNAPNTNAQNQKYSPSGAPGPDPTSLFQREDVKETSYRVSTGKIDVHLCDDTPIDKSLLDGHGQTGGSMQIVVNNLSFEHYPYHLAFTSRVHWSSHNEASLTRAQWVQELFSFYKEVMKEDAKKSKRKGSPQKPDTNVSQPNHSFPTHDSRASGKAAVDTNTATRKRSHIYLYECAFVISCDELIIMPVATNEKMNSSSAPFLCSDKKSLYLPRDLPALQFDYTLYFYPGLEDAKVPQPNLFCQLNPLHLTMDNVTCIWFHKFMQSIRSGFIWAEELIAAQGATPRHIDVRIEGLMPKITLPCPSESDCYYKQYRPQAIQIQMSSFRVSNTRIGTEFKQSDLVNTLDKFRQSQLYTQSEVFPNDARDVKPLPQSAWLNDFSVCSGVETIERFLTGVQEDYSENHTSVVWILNARQCWCDFIGVEETGGRPRPFVEPFPLNLCMCYPILTATSQSSNVEYNHQAAGPQFQRDVYASTADRHYHADAPPLIISAGDLSKPGGLSLHRSPSDPYCKQARPHRKDSSTRSTPLSSPRFAKIHKSRSATSVNIPVIQSDLRKVEPITAHPSGSSSLSRSGSEESCESFYADTGVGRAQSHKSKSNLPDASVRNRPSSASSQVYQNTPLTFSISGTDSLSDDSPDRVSESADETLVISTEKDKETALNSDKEPKCALSILLYVPDVLGLKLDHYQFVFLMRLQESIITLRDILFADAERFDGHRRKLREKDRSYSVKTSTEPEGIAVSLVSKGAEVVLLVPAPSEELVDSRLETEQGRKSHENQFRKSPGTESPGSPEYANGTGAGVVDAVFQTVVDIDQTSLDADNARPEPSDELDDGSAEGQRHPIRTFEVAGEESRVEKSGHERSSSYLPDSKQPYLQSSLGDISSNTHAHRKPCASDPSSVNTSNYGSDASLQTGGSSVASEKSCRGRDVSTVTIHGASLECSLAMNDEDFAFKLLARGCQVDEGYHESLETFLTHKVKKRCKNSDGGSRQAGEIRLRYALGSTVDQTVEGVVEKGLAYVSLTDIVVSLLMSNLDGVLECIQDEANASPPFMPAVVDIKNLKATMESDTPVRLASIPPSLPLDLHVVSGTIKRTAQGHFEATVHPESLASRSDQVCVNVDGLVVDPKEMLDRLRVENNEMASRVSSIMKENYRLTRELEVSKEAKESLENEKERLLVTVARLTDELVRSNREHDEMQNIVRQYQKS